MSFSEDQIAELLDKQALHDNLMEYCRGADHGDVELMKSTYWPDSTDDHGLFVGNGHDWCEYAGTGRAAHGVGPGQNAGSAEPANRPASAPSGGGGHHMGNVYCEIEGNRAKRESRFIVVMQLTGEPFNMLGGRYRDLCEKREGKWKVLRRVCIWDWCQEAPYAPGWGLMAKLGLTQLSNWGTVYPHDPIYQDWYSSPQTLATDSGRPDVSLGKPWPPVG